MRPGGLLRFLPPCRVAWGLFFVSGTPGGSLPLPIGGGRQCLIEQLVNLPGGTSVHYHQDHGITGGGVVGHLFHDLVGESGDPVELGRGGVHGVPFGWCCSLLLSLVYVRRSYMSSVFTLLIAIGYPAHHYGERGLFSSPLAPP